VEKLVDYFLEFSEEIQDFPLAKYHSFLIDEATPYISINLKRASGAAGGLTGAGTSTQDCRVIHRCS
jgi:hypothetical protein